MEVRRAVAGDEAALAELAERTFVETFVEDFAMGYPPEDLRALIDEVFTPPVFRRRIEDAETAVWVAEHESRLVGYATAGPCGLPHPEVTSESGELKQLYVAREAQGLGVGRALLDTALAWLTSEARRPIFIGVWSGNLRAQAVYAAKNFERVGEYGFKVGRTVDREFILRRD